MPDDRIERPCSCRDRHNEVMCDPDPSCDRCGGSGWLPTGPPPPGTSGLLDVLERLERKYGREWLERMAAEDEVIDDPREPR